MTETASPLPQPPSPQGDGGVRVIRIEGRGRLRASLYLGAALLLLLAAVWALWPAPRPQVRPEAARVTPDRALSPDAAGGTEPRGVVPPIARLPQPRRVAQSEEPPELTSLDPDDLAAWVGPGDPEPTMAEVIDALRQAGIHDGIAAFNPPGTRPALEGIVVPDDFELPPGYVRHHQVTDEGEVIEPILMFSPDFEFVDASGRPIVVPEDGVVPPELAPPGMPIRRVRIPSP
ncbi:MAG: hypothetical protein MEQ07_11000 [Aquimonas sp.]|nr:hypothetical protein [Aquimonas sp.]